MTRSEGFREQMKACDAAAGTVVNQRPQRRPSSVTQPRLLVVGGDRSIGEIVKASAIGAIFTLSFAKSSSEVRSVADGKPPHLVIADMQALDLLAVTAVRDLIRALPEAPLLVVTDHATERQCLGVLRAGASGCLFREDLPRRLISAIHEALDGGAPMSRAVATMVLDRARRYSGEMRAVAPMPPVELGARKREILDLLARGLSYDQIGMSLGISVNTVRSHVREIYGTLEVSTKVEAVMIAVQRGILKPQ